MRKAALASALTLLLTLSTTPALIATSAHESTALGSALGYLPVASDWIFPVGNPRVAPTYDPQNGNGYTITQMFNNSCDPALNQGYYMAGQYFCGHTGVDLSNKSEGGTVVATAAGMVVYAGFNSSYGEMVRIQHLMPDGAPMYSQYEHMEYGQLDVGYGQIVSMGQPIGLVGSTGFVTGAHLHFEIKSVDEDGPGYSFGNLALINGYVDPIAFIIAHTVHLEPTATATPPPTATPAISATAIISATTPVTSGNTGDESQAGGNSESVTARNGGDYNALLAEFNHQYHDYVTVTAKHLNVRTGSGFRFAPINSVKKGARLGYLGMSGNGWVHVALPSRVYGYVALQWVDGTVLPKLPDAQWGNLTPPFATVLDDLYPARVGPRMSAPAVEPLWRGEKLTYLGTAGSWDKVVLPSQRVAWVLCWYLHQPKSRVDIALPPVIAGLAPTDHAGDKTAVTSKGRRYRASLGSTAGHSTMAAASMQPRPAPAPVPASWAYVLVTGGGLRLRMGPRLSAGVIELLPQGARLGVLSYHTSWIAVVAPDGTSGYVLSWYVKRVGPGPSTAVAALHAQAPYSAAPAPNSAAPEPEPHARVAAEAQQPAATDFRAPFVVVTVYGANLRTGPSRKETVIVSEPYNTRLAVRGSQGQWLHVVSRRGVDGWMMGYLTKPIGSGQ